MTDDADSRAWRTLTDRDRIRAVAGTHGAVPTDDPSGEGVTLHTGSEPDDSGGERLAWDRFFERLDREDRVLRYRPPGEGGADAAFEVVGRDLADERGGGETTDDPADAGRERIATSDTGDEEPVVAYGPEDDGEDPADDPSTASTGDAVVGPTPAADGLVLDEIHGGTGLGRDLEDEYLVFVNDGAERIDLSGWGVENGAGRSYRFPDGTELAPGDRLTLHSGRGEDAEGHRYWNAAEPVWSARDTVTVTTATGERVLREPFES